MKAKLFLLMALFSSVPPFAARSQTVVTFDDISETGSGAWFDIKYQGYQGLTWGSILCNNAILDTGIWGHIRGALVLTGNYYGMVSASNVAVMGSGSEVDSPGTKFNFLGAFLTGFLSSNLNIEVQGFRDTNLVYDETRVVAATYPTLCTFNYLDIDRLVFSSSGGQPAFGVPDISNGGFDMDNFMFEYIPEPSSLLLTILGVLTLWGFHRRRTV